MKCIIMCQSVDSKMLINVSDYSKTQKMCGKAVEKYLKMLKIVSYYFQKTQNICKKVYNM